MVRSEDWNTIKSEGHFIVKANEGGAHLEMDQKEREIVRSLLIAEKDKRDAMLTLEHIRSMFYIKYI